MLQNVRKENIRKEARTKDSVERVPHVDGVELGSREGTAHGSVRCKTTHFVRNGVSVLSYFMSHQELHFLLL